ITPTGTGDLCNVGENVLGDEGSRILLFGRIGYTGRHVAKASSDLGHPTYLLVKQSTASNPQKAELLEYFKASVGLHLHTELHLRYFQEDGGGIHESGVVASRHKWVYDG
ncbi:hypothetical protein KI387_042799, partial [Taxus chinensis]